MKSILNYDNKLMLELWGKVYENGGQGKQLHFCQTALAIQHRSDIILHAF